jgi:hypothetical protein
MESGALAMRVRLSFASMEKVKAAVAEMTDQIERGEEPYIEMPVEDAEGLPVEHIHIQFIDEANDEFAEPSATVSR